MVNKKAYIDWYMLSVEYGNPGGIMFYIMYSILLRLVCTILLFKALTVFPSPILSSSDHHDLQEMYFCVRCEGRWLCVLYVLCALNKPTSVERISVSFQKYYWNNVYYSVHSVFNNSKRGNIASVVKEELKKNHRINM